MLAEFWKIILSCLSSPCPALSAVWPPARGRQKIWTIRRSSWPCKMPRWLPGTRSDRASTAAATSSTASLFAYQVKALALIVALPRLFVSLMLISIMCSGMMQVLLISCRPTMPATFAASSRLCLKSWQPSVIRMTTTSKRKVKNMSWIYDMFQSNVLTSLIKSWEKLNTAEV